MYLGSGPETGRASTLTIWLKALQSFNRRKLDVPLDEKHSPTQTILTLDIPRSSVTTAISELEIEPIYVDVSALASAKILALLSW